MSEHDADFRALAEHSGVPTTTSAINTAFNETRIEAGVTITNGSPMSPFWRFVNGIATGAAKWLIEFIITSVLPQAFAKTATGVFLEMHAWAVGLERKLTSKAAGRLLFTRTDTAGVLVIPANVIIQSVPVNGKVYSVRTTVFTSIGDGDSSSLVKVEALETGSAYNLDADYYTVLPVAVDGIASVTNTSEWLEVPGADTETDEQLRARIRNQYDAVNQWHTDAVYTAILTQFSGINTDNVYFEHNAPRGPGTANAYILLDVGTPSSTLLANMQAEITNKENHGHGDDLAVLEMPETEHNVTCTVWPLPTLTVDEVTALLSNVEQFIRCAFRENSAYSNVTRTYPLEIFSFSRLAQEIHTQFPGVKNVAFSLSVIENDLDICRLDTLTVSEN